jgi:hypothetical protein
MPLRILKMSHMTRQTEGVIWRGCFGWELPWCGLLLVFCVEGEGEDIRWWYDGGQAGVARVLWIGTAREAAFESDMVEVRCEHGC